MVKIKLGAFNHVSYPQMASILIPTQVASMIQASNSNSAHPQ
ncbi:uncharacterized protein G2W53_030490 [Senna tora]|uniref:Uncharacterized protein n=1 Tax=Senna tora TaxID=362788 RepID=A0A834T7I4_9FABA|nr:uncharacterized protein G2W53_030490 [Senna tora]